MQTAEEKKLKQAARRRKWYLANREKAIAQTRDWRKVNPEKVAATRAAHRETDRDKAARKRRERSEEQREAVRAKDRAYYAANKERLALSSAVWRKNNIEKRRVYKQDYFVRNKDTMVAKNREWRIRNIVKSRDYSRVWREANPEKCAAKRARRRAVELRATPDWLTQNQLDAIIHLYWKARVCRLSTGQIHDVDHIVPLRGKRVCGLHIPWNLQVLTAEANNAKGNKLLPQDQLVDYSARGYIGTEFEPEKLIPRKAA